MGMMDLFSDLFKEEVHKQSDTLKNERWTIEYKNIAFHNDPYCETEHMGKNFYRSSYACPYCKGVMLKTVFPPKGEYMIRTTEGAEYLKRAFTCPKCKTVIAPIPGNKLDIGKIIEKKYDRNNEYVERINDMDGVATTQGRPDL